VQAFAHAGWRSVELWLTKLETYLERATVSDARNLFEQHSLEPLAASSQGGLLLSLGPERDAHWEQYVRRLEILQELGVPTLVISADSTREPKPEDYPRACDALARAAESARAHRVRLALEFQKSSRFCACLSTALALIRQSGAAADALGVCLDFFHFDTGPSKMEDLADLRAEDLAWVQVCDLSGTLREIAGDTDRILPGEGDFPIGPLLQHLARIGYDGGVSVELFNPRLWPIPADRVADAAYRAARRFLEPSLARATGATAGGS